MSADHGADLKAACDEILADPALRPQQTGMGLTTFCNQGLMRVARTRGCQELDGLMADEQYQVMATNASGHWRRCTGSEAAIHALGGGLAVAAMPSQRLQESHGHVAAVYPVGMQLSPSLGRDVPMVANIGKTIGLMKSSAAFPIASGEADYFAWA